MGKKHMAESTGNHHSQPCIALQIRSLLLGPHALLGICDGDDDDVNDGGSSFGGHDLLTDQGPV